MSFFALELYQPVYLILLLTVNIVNDNKGKINYV